MAVVFCVWGILCCVFCFFFFSSRRRHTRLVSDWSSDVCSSDLGLRRVIQAKTPGQREYLQAIAQHDIVVGIGPAGTGKTYLAVAAAVDALSRKRVRRIVLARPAVEAGESLGFLPGDLQEKVDPYLR